MSLDPSLLTLLHSYTDLFTPPTTLPPFRPGFNHKIPLLQDSNPICQRPYRYSMIQKNAIDKIIEDMLQQGIIQYSNSPYASPVVLVKKKDGTLATLRGLQELEQSDHQRQVPYTFTGGSSRRTWGL